MAQRGTLRPEFEQAAALQTAALPASVLANISGIADMNADALDKVVDSAIARDRSVEENDQLFGLKSGASEGINKLSLFNIKLRERLTQEAKNKGGIDPLLLLILEEIAALQQELNELNDRIAEQEAAMVEQYGEDYMDDMADMYLSDEERASLEGLSPDEREEAIREMLSDKMLNPDGSIKDEYKDQPIAGLLRDWARRDKIEAGIQKLENADTPRELTKVADELKADGILTRTGTEYAVRETGATNTDAFNVAAENGSGNLIQVGLEIEENDSESIPDAEAFNNNFDSFINGI